MDQEVGPKKIILWLNDSLKNSIPGRLRKLEGATFEIRFSHLSCSHRKLIHALDSFPEETIITCDDDLIYARDWAQSLYTEHLKNPNTIIANQTRFIRYDAQGNLLPYKQWVYTEESPFNQRAVIPIGAGGVLYPPHTLSEKTTDVDLFLKLAPKADDLWFKAMSLLKGTLSIQANNAPAHPPIPILASQTQSLKKGNVDQDKNRVQWSAVSSYFDLQI